MTFTKIPGFGSQASTFNTDFFGGLEKREFALNAALARKALMTKAAMEGADIFNENTIAMGKKAGAAAERSGWVSGLTSLGTSLIGGLGKMGSSGAAGSLGNPFGPDQAAGTAGFIDFGQGGGINYANQHGRLTW